MVTKMNSKLCQTSEMEPCKNSKKLKAVPYFSQNCILDVWQGSEYATELAFKVKDVSKPNQFEHQK